MSAPRLALEPPPAAYVPRQLDAPTPIRWFVAHLTEYAPGCEARPIGAAERWLRLGNVPHERAIAALLAALDVAPRAVVFKDQRMGDVAVLLLGPDGKPRLPLAFIVEGPDAAEASLAAATLAANG